MKFGVGGRADYKCSSVLRAPGYEHVDEQWFCPDFWADKAQPVAAGGRGSAWFIQSGRYDLVLRHYRRGGMMAHLSQRNYLYSGWGQTRSFREFRLLETLKARGLPVPTPVAAWAGRKGLLWYHAAILIERIPGSVPLPEASEAQDEALWTQVGKTVRRFHDIGLEHVDLNCDNILLASGKVYLIDFDRCRLRQSDTFDSWKKNNLNRLRRSVDKRLQATSAHQRDSLWQALQAGYHAT